MKKNLLILIGLFFGKISFAQNPWLWGVTTFGGAAGGGAIVSINGDGTGFNTVYSLNTASGTIPRNSLCLAPNGKLYGATTAGGANGVGTVFCFEPSGGVFTKIVDFNYTNGAYAWGSIMLASSGMLYGTSYGGANGDGNIFRINPAGNIYNVLHNLGSGDGASPGGKMTESPNGLLYGMTAYGGASSGGTIFSFNPAGNIFTKHYDFGTIDGRTGYGSLLYATDGNLYGMARNGGAYGIGVLFKFDPLNSIYTKLLDFDTLNGRGPWNGITQISGTKLYGMTTNGGHVNGGVIFSYDISTGIYTVEHNFDITNGSVPFGSLMKATDNNIYGMTFNGGDFLSGTVFRFDTLTDALTVLHSFNTNDGASPSGDLVEVPAITSVQEQTNLPFRVFPNPARNEIEIDLGESYPAETKLMLTDLTGRKLAEFPVTGMRTLIPVCQAPGIYFLRCITENQSMSVKIILQ